MKNIVIIVLSILTVILFIELKTMKDWSDAQQEMLIKCIEQLPYTEIK